MNSWKDKSKSSWDIIYTPKPFGQVMKEFNEEAEKEIRNVTGIDKINPPIIPDVFMKAAETDWNEHQEINGGINQVALGVKDRTGIWVGVDKGSDDKTTYAIWQDRKCLCIGEDIELLIPEGWKDKIVKAIQIGDLAVITSEDEEHCIAHVPTQTWFDNAIPDNIGSEEGYTIEQLCLWAWKVQQDKLNLWKLIAVHNNASYKTIDKHILNKVREWCLSVSVS